MAEIICLADFRKARATTNSLGDSDSEAPCRHYPSATGTSEGSSQWAIESEDEALDALLALRDFFWDADYPMPLNITTNLVIDLLESDCDEPDLTSAVREAMKGVTLYLGPDSVSKVIEVMTGAHGAVHFARPLSSPPANDL